MQSGNVAVALFLAAVIAGCATFADPPAPSEAPVTGARLEVDVSGEAFLEHAPGDWREWGDAHTDFSLHALSTSGWFESVSESLDPYDYRAEIRIRQYQGYTYGGFLSLITAFLVPSKRHHRVEVAADITSSSGEVARCHVHEEYVVWHQTLLLFAYPFAAPAWHKIRLVEELTLRCFSRALAELRDA